MIDLDKMKLQAYRGIFTSGQALDLIEAYEELNSRLESLEKDSARWRAATRDTEINDIAVCSFDKYGDDKIVMGDEADSIIDAAMQARQGVSEELK